MKIRRQDSEVNIIRVESCICIRYLDVDIPIPCLHSGNGSVSQSLGCNSGLVRTTLRLSLDDFRLKVLVLVALAVRVA